MNDHVVLLLQIQYCISTGTCNSSLPTMKTTSASSDPLKAIVKSWTSLSGLVYFSLTGSRSGLGGLEEGGKKEGEEEEEEEDCTVSFV